MRPSRRLAVASRPRAVAAFEHLESRRLLSAGDNDWSFGQVGHATHRWGWGGRTHDVVVVADGKVVVAGEGSTADVLRINADGTRDNSFPGLALADAWFFALTAQSDGKFVVAGGDGDMAVARLNADGTPDVSFGTSGVIRTDLGGLGDRAFAVAVQPDGKVVVAGSSAGPNRLVGFVARYLPDGAPDPSFGVAGVQTAPFDRLHVNDLVLQPDGRILVGGYRSLSSSDDLAVARLNPDGSLDATFGVGGHFTPPPAFAAWFSARVAEMALLPDGDVLLGGHADSAKALLVRLNADATVDTAFGSGGRVMSDVPGSRIGALTVMPDRRIVAVGGAREPDGTSTRGALFRFNADGSTDLTFGNRGHVIDLYATGEATGMSLYPGGKLIATGQNFVARYWLDVPSPTFGSLGADGTLTLGGDGVAGDYELSPGAAGQLLVTRGGESLLFDRSQVQRVEILGAWGADSLRVPPSVALPIRFDGGAGFGPNTLIVEGTAGADVVAIGPGSVGIAGAAVVSFTNLHAVTVNAGDGNDRFTAAGANPGVSVTLDGGRGDDELDAAAASSPLVLVGGAGSNRFFSRNGVADTLDGALGWDHADVDPADLLQSIEFATGGSGGVEGYVLSDPDVDGVHEEGEPPMAGCTVWLDADRDGWIDEGERSAVTDANGHYVLEDLPSGQSLIAVQFPAGWRHSGTGNNQWVSVLPGRVATSNPFLGTRGIVVRGYVAEDIDGDGWHGDGGLSGWTVYLDVNKNGMPDAGEPAAVSDTSGLFQLGGIAGGTYELRQVPRAGWRTASPDAGFYRISLPDLGYAFGYTFLNTTTALVTGTLYRDLDRDGLRDAGEPPMPGWYLYLDRNNNGQRDWDDPVQYSDEQGVYAFAVTAGTYTVRVPNPETWVRTAPTGDGARWATVTDAQVAAGQDFGYRRLFTTHFAGAWLFYNNSAFDAEETPDDPWRFADDAAIAGDKLPLLPGQTPSFRNVSSYTKGINGLMIDVSDLANTTLTPDDLDLKVGDGSAAGWRDAPRPTGIAVRDRSWMSVASPVPDVERVVVTWPDGAVRNQWLRVTVKANLNTGLTQPYVFYYASLVGKTDAAGDVATIGAADVTATRSAQDPRVAPSSPFDFNRDGRVNVLDVATARANVGKQLAAPQEPVAPPAASSMPPLRKRRSAYLESLD